MKVLIRCLLFKCKIRKNASQEAQKTSAQHIQSKAPKNSRPAQNVTFAMNKAFWKSPSCMEYLCYPIVPTYKSLQPFCPFLITIFHLHQLNLRLGSRYLYIRNKTYFMSVYSSLLELYQKVTIFPRNQAGTLGCTPFQWEGGILQNHRR